MVSLSILPLCRVLLERTKEERGSQVGFYGGSEAKVEAKGDNGSCRVVSGSCRFDKKSYNKRVVSSQPVLWNGSESHRP